MKDINKDKTFKPTWSRDKNLRRDLLIVTLVGVLIFVVASIFELYETIHEKTRLSEIWQIDEVPFLFFALALSLVWFAYRRLRETQVEMAERKRAEEDLKAATILLEKTFASLEEVVFVVDSDTRTISSSNPAVERVFGYSKEEMVGRNTEFLHVDRSSYEQFGHELSAALDSNGVFHTEFRLRRKDGSVFPTEHTVTEMVDDSGRQTHLVSIVRDITERKRAEEELQKHRENLEELVEERTAELSKTVEALENEIAVRKRAEEELIQTHKELRQTHEAMVRAQQQLIRSEKLAAVGQLTAGVSHEILNPLNIISVGLQLGIADPETPPAITHQMRLLKEQADRITKITRDLLHVAHQRPPERRPVDLNETLKRTLGLLEHDLKLSNIDVEADLAEELPPVHADQDQLQQVVLNLLNNARDAMPEGGRLTLRSGAVQDYGRRFVEFRVEDTGPGINPEHLDKLFDPFFTTKDEGEGTGLGLSICQAIVEAHGGEIWAENGPGGASFVIRLGVEVA